VVEIGDRRYIDYRGFELTEDFCHRGSESPEITRSDQDRPLEEDAWRRSEHSGDFPKGRFVHRHYGNREIGNPVDKKSLQFGIAKSKTRQGGKCHRGANCQHIGESAFERSFETPKSR
jgi:hypothetical protein